MESGEQARPVHNKTWAHNLACMHAMCLHAQGPIVAKFGWIRKIKVSMESEEQNGLVWGHSVTQAHNSVCMHTMFQHAESHILAKLCQISEIKVSMEYQVYYPRVWTYSGSFEGARGLKRRPTASHRGQRHPNCPPLISLCEHGNLKFLGSTWAKNYCRHQTWRTINFHQELICQESNQLEIQVCSPVTWLSKAVPTDNLVRIE